jgi:hypothetical protein
METSWFVRRIKYYTDSTGQSGIQLTCYDLLDLLDRRIVAYESGSSYTSKNDVAETIMKDLIYENLGVSAFDPLRDMSAYLSVQSTHDYGAIITKDCSWARLLATIQELASTSEQLGVRIIFDIAYLSINSFEFRVWQEFKGVDRGVNSIQPLVVSLEAGNLSSPELIMDYTSEYSYIYAGGRGEGVSREVQEVYDSLRIGASIFNRREGFVDARNSYSASAVATEANWALYTGRPRILFSGDVLQTPNTVYGINYKYGDKLVAQYKGYSFDCRVNSMIVKHSNEGEEIQTRLIGEQII